MTEPLTPALIGANFKARYACDVKLLHEWERSKAKLLTIVGADSLALIREKLEPLPDHHVTGRKAIRAELVKAIEAELPADCEGIGVPQLNRWIRWAGLVDVIGGPESAAQGAFGLKQAHLMTLERYFDQHEATGTFRLKDSWKDAVEGIRAAVDVCVTNQSSAAELEAAIDALASVPEQKEPAAPAQPSTKPAAEAPKPSEVKPVPAPTAAPATAPAPKTVPAPSNAKPKPVAPSPAPSPTPSAASKSAPVANGSSAPSAKDLADQAFKLLQQDDILAGVFRRDWEPIKVLAIAENLIRACGEKSPNLLGLAKAYHRMKPLVLTHFDEVVIDDKYKLTQKDNPEPPTLEQLAPMAELATA